MPLTDNQKIAVRVAQASVAALATALHNSILNSKGQRLTKEEIWIVLFQRSDSFRSSFKPAKLKGQPRNYVPTWIDRFSDLQHNTHASLGPAQDATLIAGQHNALFNDAIGALNAFLEAIGAPQHTPLQSPPAFHYLKPIDQDLTIIRDQGDIYPIPTYSDYQNARVPDSPVVDEINGQLEHARIAHVRGIAASGKTTAAFVSAFNLVRNGTVRQPYFVDMGIISEPTEVITECDRLFKRGGDALLIIDNAHRWPNEVSTIASKWSAIAASRRSRLLLVETKRSLTKVSAQAHPDQWADVVIESEINTDFLKQITKFLVRKAGHEMDDDIPDLVATDWLAGIGKHMHVFGFAVLHSAKRLANKFASNQYVLVHNDALDWIRANWLHYQHNNAPYPLEPNEKVNLLLLSAFGAQNLELGVPRSALPYPNDLFARLSDRGVVGKFNTSYMLMEHGWGSLILEAAGVVDESTIALMRLDAAVRSMTLATGHASRLTAASSETASREYTALIDRVANQVTPADFAEASLAIITYWVKSLKETYRDKADALCNWAISAQNNNALLSTTSTPLYVFILKLEEMGYNNQVADLIIRLDWENSCAFDSALSGTANHLINMCILAQKDVALHKMFGAYLTENKQLLELHLLTMGLVDMGHAHRNTENIVPDLQLLDIIHTIPAERFTGAQGLALGRFFGGWKSEPEVQAKLLQRLNTIDWANSTAFNSSIAGNPDDLTHLCQNLPAKGIFRDAYLTFLTKNIAGLSATLLQFDLKKFGETLKLLTRLLPEASFDDLVKTFAGTTAQKIIAKKYLGYPLYELKPLFALCSSPSGPHVERGKAFLSMFTSKYWKQELVPSLPDGSCSGAALLARALHYHGHSKVAGLIADHIATRANVGDLNVNSGLGPTRISQIATVLQLLKTRVLSQPYFNAMAPHVTQDISNRGYSNGVIANGLYGLSVVDGLDLSKMTRQSALQYRSRGNFVRLPQHVNADNHEKVSNYIQLIGAMSTVVAPAIYEHNLVEFLESTNWDEIIGCPRINPNPLVDHIQGQQQLFWLGLREIARVKGQPLTVDAALLANVADKWNVAEKWNATVAHDDGTRTTRHQSMLDGMATWLEACVAAGATLVAPTDTNCPLP